MTKNRIIAYVLSLCILGGASSLSYNHNSISSLSAYASEEETYKDGVYENLRYRAYSDHVQIIGVFKVKSEMEIPSKINDLPVTEISDNAFLHKESISSVKIPNSVKTIGDHAFAVTGLTEITIPGSVKTIGNDAFSGCKSLAKITLQNGIESIGSNAFYFCQSLTEAAIPSSVESIGYYAFKDCSALNSVTINGCKTCDQSVFLNCSNLKKVTISDGVEALGREMFRNCTSLTEITIPGSVSSIPNFIFWECTNLKNATILNGVESIEYKAFYECESLTDVILPNSLKSIGDNAFDSCENLLKISLPESLTSLGREAFENTALLNSQKAVSLETLGLKYADNWIIDCDGNVSGDIIKPDTAGIADYAFLQTSITDLVIPQSVKYIGKNAFQGCFSIKEMNIPKNVISIGENAFYQCGIQTLVIINPECEIQGTKSTICSSIGNGEYPFNGIIYGYSNSTAQTYAKTYNRKFIALDGTSKLGDVNFDNHADSDDASLVLAEYARKATQKPLQFSSQQNESADVNFDGNIDSDDASLILSYYAYTAVGGTQSPEEFFSR